MGIFQLFNRWLNETIEIVKSNVKQTAKEHVTGSQEHNNNNNQWKKWQIIKTKNLIGADIELEGVTYIVEDLTAGSQNLKRKATGLALSLIAAKNCSVDKFSDSLKILERTPEALMYLTDDFRTGEQGCAYIQDAYKFVQYSLDACAGSNDLIYRDTAKLVGATEKLIARFCTDPKYRSRFRSSKPCPAKGWACAKKTRAFLMRGGMGDLLEGVATSGMGKAREINPEPHEIDDVCQATTRFNSCSKDRADCEDMNANKKAERKLRDTVDNYCIKHRSWKGAQKVAAPVEGGGTAGVGGTGSRGADTVRGSQPGKSDDKHVTSEASLPMLKTTLSYLPLAAFRFI